MSQLWWSQHLGPRPEAQQEASEPAFGVADEDRRHQPAAAVAHRLDRSGRNLLDSELRRRRKGNAGGEGVRATEERTRAIQLLGKIVRPFEPLAESSHGLHAIDLEAP
jgi:hypothetical protein